MVIATRRDTIPPYEAASFAGARLNLPVFLGDDVRDYVQERAEVKGVEIGRLVNDLPKREIELIESVK